MIDTILKRFGYGRKAASPGVPSVRVTHATTGLPAANWTANNYESRVTEGYEKNSDVFAAISLVATAASEVRWWDGTGSKSKKSNPRPSIQLLNDSGAGGFVSDWVKNMCLNGNAWTEIVRGSARGQPSMLFLINPVRITYIRNPEAKHPNEMVSAWRVADGGGRARLLKPWRDGRGDVVQSKHFSPLDPVFGQAPLEAAMRRVDVGNEMLTLQRRVLQRGYVPGWIKADKDSEWGDEQVTHLRERVRASKQAGEELFLENAEWHPMGFQPTADGMNEQQILCKRDIASVFHVPAQLLNDAGSQTFSNFKEARRALYQEAVIPLLQLFKDDWNRTIGSELGSELSFDRDSFDAITVQRQEAAERVQRLFSTGLITQNEGRADLEYEPVQGGDRFYAPANLVPMDSPPEPDDEDGEP